MVDAMLFEQRLWAGLADGLVTVTFRCWKRPRARAGGRHRTPAGVLAVDAVAEVEVAAIGEDDARAAGFASLSDLLRQLDRHGDGPVYRVDSTMPAPTPGRRCARTPSCPRRNSPGWGRGWIGSTWPPVTVPGPPPPCG